MPLTVEKIEKSCHLVMSGDVRAEPDAPVQYTNVEDRKFRPETWVLVWVRYEGEEWRLSHWTVRGPILNKDGRTSRRISLWRGGRHNQEMTEAERQAFPWLADLINANRPKES